MSGIRFVYSQTSYLYSRIMIALLAEWDFAINAVAHIFLCLVKADDIVQQTIIGNDVVILHINKKVSNSKILCLIIFRFIQIE